VIGVFHELTMEESYQPNLIRIIAGPGDTAPSEVALKHVRTVGTRFTALVSFIDGITVRS
jgi:hypothetical protein